LAQGDNRVESVGVPIKDSLNSAGTRKKKRKRKREGGRKANYVVCQGERKSKGKAAKKGRGEALTVRTDKLLPVQGPTKKSSRGGVQGKTLGGQEGGSGGGRGGQKRTIKKKFDGGAYQHFSGKL